MVLCDIPHRQKSGIWGFRSDRVENISGYDTKVSTNHPPCCSSSLPPCLPSLPFPFCSPFLPHFHLLLPQVFSASGLDIVTKTRVEHLPEAEKHKHKSVNPLQDFLGGGQDGIPALDHAATIAGQPPPVEVSDSAPQLSMEEYFRTPKDPKEYDGR